MLQGKKRLVAIVSALTLIVIGVGVFLSLRGSPPDEVSPTPLAKSVTASPLEEHVVTGLNLEIAKLEVKAPILTKVNTDDEKIYLKALETGVAHYKDTPLPGEKGNAVIFGHSSYFKEKPGDYKEIFKRLNELAKGDTFTISGDKTPFEYKVTRSQVIKDDDFSVVDSSDKEIITILTCWPPGTVEKRWVVQAERVTPAVSKVP